MCIQYTSLVRVAPFPPRALALSALPHPFRILPRASSFLFVRGEGGWHRRCGPGCGTRSGTPHKNRMDQIAWTKSHGPIPYANHTVTDVKNDVKMSSQRVPQGSPPEESREVPRGLQRSPRAVPEDVRGEPLRGV